MSIRELRPMLMAAAILLGGLAGCGSSENPPSASESGAGGQPPQVASAARPKPAGTAAGDWVAAVPSGSPDGSVELKFNLSQHPQVNESVDIQFSVIPQAALDQVFVSFRAGDGLELRQGGEMPTVERPATGQSLAHTVTVVPKREGVFNVTAVVLVDSAGQSRAHTYAVPMIVGAGVPPVSASDP